MWKRRRMSDQLVDLAEQSSAPSWGVDTLAAHALARRASPTKKASLQHPMVPRIECVPTVLLPDARCAH